MPQKKALITGVTGQDGSYLAELLLEKGYEVHGLIRRTSTIEHTRINHLYRDPHDKGVSFFLHYSDLSDSSSLNRLIGQIRPDEVYHLGAMSQVRVSFDIPEYTADVTGIGTLRLLDALRATGVQAKFYNAATSEMFGNAKTFPINEETPFHPESPYACAKLFGYWTTVNYRTGYNVFACNGILFNHESPRRGETFVTRKIIRGLLAIKKGEMQTLFLGNLSAKRDWGYAPEFVEGMWLMLQAQSPSDYVLATGETHTVKEFAEEAGRHLGIDIQWRGEGVHEEGVDAKTGNVIIRVSERYFRPNEVHCLIGDASKARSILGWKPRTTFKELVSLMIEGELHPPNLYDVEN